MSDKDKRKRIIRISFIEIIIGKRLEIVNDYKRSAVAKGPSKTFGSRKGLFREKYAFWLCFFRSSNIEFCGSRACAGVTVLDTPGISFSWRNRYCSPILQFCGFLYISELLMPLPRLNNIQSSYNRTRQKTFYWIMLRSLLECGLQCAEGYKGK
jgi:hypothetical protein